MATLTNAEARQAQEALGRLVKRDLPIDAALDVRQMAREVGTYMEDVDSLRVEMLTRYAIKNEDGSLKAGDQGQAQFAKDEDRDAYGAFYQELMGKEHEYTHALRASTLGKPLSIKPELLLALGDLFIDDRGDDEEVVI